MARHHSKEMPPLLTRNPFGRRVCRDIDPDDDEGIEQIKADGRDDEQVMAAMSGAWLRRKVRHPWLGGPLRLTMYLATLDCALEQFAVDARRSPERVPNAHPPDQHAEVRLDLRPPSHALTLGDSFS
jgi:hypothetical protein